AGLERLSGRGLRIIPVTGRPAGWCDMIARFWPVDAVVGENGAFYFRYDRRARRMIRRFWLSEAGREKTRARLARLGEEITSAVSGTRIAADQPFRVADLAIDYAEDSGPLPLQDVDRVVAMMQAAGASANGQLDPYQRWVRRLGQAGDDAAVASRSIRHRSRPAARGRSVHR